MPDDLVSRFTATLDELERVARAATDGPWIFDGDAVDVEPTTRGSEYIARYVGDKWSDVTHMLPADAVHIALWDPQAVLRLVAAARKVIAMFQTSTDGRSAAANVRDLDHAGAMGRKVALGNVIELLAAALPGFGVTEED